MVFSCVSDGFQGVAVPTGSRFQRVSWDAVGHPERISDVYGCGVGFGDVSIGLCCDVRAWPLRAKLRA